MGFDVKDLPEDDGSDPFLWALNVSSLTAAMDDVIGDVGGILKQTDYLAQALVVEGGVPSPRSPVNHQARTADLTEKLLRHQETMAMAIKSLDSRAEQASIRASREARKTTGILAVAIVALVATIVGVVVATIH